MLNDDLMKYDFVDPLQVPTTQEIIEAAEMFASLPKIDRTPIKVTFDQYNALMMICKKSNKSPVVIGSKLEIMDEPEWHKKQF